MAHRWGLLRPAPSGLVHPVPVDPTGMTGPTPGLARSEAWRRTSHGLYVPREVDSIVPEQRIVEAAARLPVGAAVTGWASLLLHGGNHFDGRGPRMEELPVPVVLPPPLETSRTPGVCRLRAPLRPDEIVIRHGVRVTIPARALRDMMTRSRNLREAAIWASIACSAGLVSIEELRAHLRALFAISGSTKARDAMAYVDDRVRSPPEAALFQALYVDAGLPRPLMNWPLYDAIGTYLGAGDGLCVELGLLGEYDSSDHDDNSSRDTDADRDSRFRAAGLTVFRIGKRTMADPAKRLARIQQAAEAAKSSRIPRTFVLGQNPEPVVARELRRLALESDQFPPTGQYGSVNSGGGCNSV